MTVSADDQPNLWKGTREALFFGIFQMNHGDDEIGVPADFRQQVLECFDDIENLHTNDLVGMTLGFNIFSGQSDQAETNSARIDNGVLLDFGNRRYEIGGHYWELRFTQTQAQCILTIIKLVVTDGAGGVSNAVHRLDRWRAFKLIGEEGSGREVTRVQNQVGLGPSNDRRNFRYAANAIPWQKLPVKIIGMHDHDAR